MSVNLYNNCLKELLKKRKNFEINIEPIYQYLESFKSFIFLLKNQTSLTIEKLLLEISKQLELKRITKNELIFQQGEIADNFYIILKGNLKVLKLRPYEYYMTNEEYISYLLDLKMNHQMEIIRQCKHYNNLVYPIPENFDFFVNNLSNKAAGALYLDMHDLAEKAGEVDKYIYQEKEINQKGITKLTPEEYIKKFKVPNDIVNNTEIISNFINEKNDMNNLDEINKIKLLMKDRKKVIIPNYVEFINLSTGSTFEDQAFENHGNLFQSSVISLDDGYLGVINKKKYSLFIHESVEKRNKKLFILLVYFSFLKLNNQFLFEKKYLTYINDKVFDVHYILFQEGEESDTTFFVTEGEYELSMNKNIIEVNEMIIDYKKILKKLNFSNKINNKQTYDFDEEQRQNNDLILNRKFRSDEANELIMKKRYIKINILHKKDVLGLSDVYAYEDDEVNSKKNILTYTSVKKKCLLTCKCINSHCHAFYMPNSIFNNLYYNEGNYNIISKNLEFKKICTIIERLKIYKNSVFDLVKKAQNKFSKRIKILKEISKIPRFNKHGFNKPKIYTKIIKELRESKESMEKLAEKAQKPMNTLKYNFNLRKIKDNDEIKDNLFPSIITEQKSNKNFSIKLKKRNVNNIVSNISNNSSRYNKTQSSDFKNLFVHNILYENLFYNYTINNNSNSKNDNNDSFFQNYKQKPNILKNELCTNYNINSKKIFPNYKNYCKRNYNGLNHINLSVNENIMNRKNNLIFSYDPLAFDKFNNLFNFHFKRQMDDSFMNKTNADK